MNETPKTKNELLEEIESLHARLAELQTANQELSRYTGVVSHDLKAPLRAIHNYADFLKEDMWDSLDENHKTYIEGLCRAVREGERLVEDILKLARLDQTEVSKETVDLQDFLADLIDTLGISSDVEVRFLTEDHLVIETSCTLLRQIFQNLLTNAAKFNRSQNKRIEIGWRQVQDAGFEIFVRDNGIGIPREYQQKIFGVLERLHTDREYEGTGIGLALVQKAVEKLNGSVRVVSTPGEGSTFFVFLPASDATQESDMEIAERRLREELPHQNSLRSTRNGSVKQTSLQWNILDFAYDN